MNSGVCSLLRILLLCKSVELLLLLYYTRFRKDVGFLVVSVKFIVILLLFLYMITYFDLSLSLSVPEVDCITLNR